MVGCQRAVPGTRGVIRCGPTAGGASGEGIGVAAATLHRRMYERGLLLSIEKRGGEVRLKARKTVGGRRRQVIHIAHRGSDDTAAAHVPDHPSGPSGPTGKQRFVWKMIECRKRLREVAGVQK
jgi:hypothetical protein